MVNIFKLFKKNSEESESNNALHDNLDPIVGPYRRDAWLPIVAQQTSSPLSSKFSGIPALANKELWPCCENCNEPMQLFLQLNSNDLPDPAKNNFGEGILQVFYCTNQEKECEVTCEAFFPFSNSTLVRIVNYSPEQISVPEISSVKDAYPEKEIVAWETVDDYPNWEELESLGVSLSDEQAELLFETGFPLPNDKFLGWPQWVQGVEYPKCPKCGKYMKLVFQIDSEDNIPYMFGDVGCSHITQCEDHPEILTIAWACS